MLSIIIPAHNEASVIGRCLDALFNKGVADDVEIVVVCNGCNDATADIASSYSGVSVLNIPTASKIAALNAGDKHAKYFPRVYLDADITVSLTGLKSCANKMGSQYKISAPASNIDMSRSSWFVKAFFNTWMQLPYYKSGHMVGTGIYILTQEGRARFGGWPNVIADDAYVRALFTFDGIMVDTESLFTLYAPTNLSGLIKIRTRARFGNIQLERIYPDMTVLGENGIRSLLNVLRSNIFRLPECIVYVVVQLIVILKCRQKLATNDFGRWERDESSREL